jgi:sugar lactone lactonase YvrE
MTRPVLAKFPANYSARTQKSLCLCLLALCSFAATAWGQAPGVVIDAQQTIGYGYNHPKAIAVSSNGTIFVADTGNNQIIALDNFAPASGVNNKVSTGAFVLSSPQALAFDQEGDLYVGDTPASGGTSYGRIIELLGDGKGNLTGAANLVFAGAPLTNPISLTVSSYDEVFVGDYNVNANPAVGSLYYLSANGTPTPINVTGVAPTFIPAALATEKFGDDFPGDIVLYFVDKSSTNGGIYGIYGIADGVATPFQFLGSFVYNQPSGLAVAPGGGLYVLSLLGTGTGYNAGQQVVALGVSTPYILPSTGLGTSSAVAVDSTGNVDVLDSEDGAVIQLSSANPVNLGNVTLGQAGSQVLFNFEFNAPTTLKGFRTVSQGDVSSELTKANGGTCANGSHTNLGAGGPPISGYYPYSCKEYFYGNPKYPGIRSSAIQVKGADSTILASQPVYQTGFAAVQVTYPLQATQTAGSLQQPQGIAISGLNKTVYIADTQAGKVYSTDGLGGGTLTPVSTGNISLAAPTAVALDGAGNLFIADFDSARVIEVPTTTGVAPSVVNTGGLLQHPMALAFDFRGNLYIGDAGQAGVEASASTPGYVLKVPVQATTESNNGYLVAQPYILTIPSVQVIFPQALATDPYTAALLIGDGGDVSTGIGQVVQVSADGSSAGTGPVNGVTNPTGLAFDQAENLYVLDGTANTITVVAGPQLPGDQYLLQFDNSSLSAASALGMSAGSQSFVVAGVGNGSNNSLLLLNGNRSTLAFGKVRVGSQSPTMTATEYNIGNLMLTLNTPYYQTSGTNPEFNLLDSSTCGDGVALNPSISCTLNFQFKPTSTGATSQKLTIQSNGYNSGVPILTLSGTGQK